MSVVDPPLDAAALRAALGPQRIGNRVVVLEETASTNDAVYQLANESKEGLVVFAERQTAGRGQHGKRWESAAHKGLCFSILLRPTIALPEAPLLISAATQSIARAIQIGYSLRARVKQPNDVYVDDRKVAGVLLEMRAVHAAPHLGILGLGVNVNQTLDDFPEELRASAGSLAMACGRPVDRHEVAVAVLRELERVL